MIRLNDIVVKFDNFTALHGINVHVKEGEFFTFLGPSGCGKTTTLRTITGFIEPAEGTVVVKEQDITHVPIEDRNIGIVFQSYALFPTMTVYDNIAFGLKVKKAKRAEIDQRVRDIARKVDLSDEQLQKAVSQLSGGQQQRVAIARALVTNPAIICMDEPLSNLDAKFRVQLRNELKKMQKDFGITTIYVTHDQEEAMAVSDRIAVINKGDIQQVGTPKDIYQRPANLFVATFIGRSNVLDGELRMENGKPVLHFHAGASITLDNVRAEECKNQPVKNSVRPEEFILDASTDATGLKATVDSSVFLGLNTHYFAHTDDGDKIEIIQESQIDSIIPDGTVVRLGVKTEKINVFDAEGKQNLLEGVRNDNAV